MAATTQHATGRRFVFIDLYRSVVILLMLEGHTVRALLDTNLQQSVLFRFHEFFHGLSAPAFLFGAGLTFVVSTRNRWVEYHHWGPPLAKRVARLVLILALGMAIHLPYFSIRKIISNGSEADFLQLFECDVLHCIGLGLLALHGIVFFFRSEERFYGLVLAVVAGACFLTPLVWDIDVAQHVPVFITQLLNSLHGSPFPLFPYIGFLFAGVIVSWEFMIAQQRNSTGRFMRRLAMLGGGLIAVGLISDALPLQVYPVYNFWYTSPSYFFIRTGSLFLLCSIAWHVADRWQPSNKLFVVAGQESLFIYVVHLPLLYGSVINPVQNLTTFLGPHQQVGATVGITALVVAIMILLALGWNYVKRKHFNQYRLLQLILGGWFLVELFTRDN